MTTASVSSPPARAWSRVRAGGVRLWRTAWIVATLFALGLFAAGLPDQYRRFLALHGPDPYGSNPSRVRAGLRAAGMSSHTYANAVLTLDLLLAAAFVGVALLVFARRGRDRWTLAFAFALVAFGTSFALVPQALADAHASWRIPVELLQLAGLAGAVTVLFLFPDGRAVPRWSLAVIAGYTIWEGARLFSSSARHALDGTAAFVTLIVVVALVVAQVQRYLRVSTPVERQQTKAAVLGIVATMVGFLTFGYVLPAAVPGADAPGSLAALLLTAGLFASLLLVPAALAVALLRYRLWDVDVVVNRSLVYAALTLCVAGVYATVVAGLGAAINASTRIWPSVLATALVAILINPLRTRLQRGVNHLLYGRRDEPLAVLSGLGLQLERAVEPDELLGTVVHRVRDALRLPYAAVLLADEEGKLVASGDPGPEVISFPLVHQGIRQGELRASPRPGDRSIHPRDRELLESLARHAAATAHSVRLASQLQRSRERTVTALEEERRRLRRDLHDGLGPGLASLRLKLAALRRRIPADADTAARIDDLRDDLGTLVADVRRLVYGLRPPALDELGLLNAIGELAHQPDATGLEIAYSRPDELPSIPAAVEVAAYRIVQETFANVLRHARATRCSIELRLQDATLTVTVEDNGIGLPAAARPGVGLRSMEERAGELGGVVTFTPRPGGGTIVRASLPIGEAADG